MERMERSSFAPLDFHLKWLRGGQWWWSSGQRACPQLQRYEFESCWILQFFNVKYVLWKERKVSKMPGLAHLKMKYVEEFGSSQNESMIREKLRFLHHVRINNNFLIPKFRTEKSTKPNWARIETIFCCLYYKVFHHCPHYEFHRKDKKAFLCIVDCIR